VAFDNRVFDLFPDLVPIGDGRGLGFFDYALAFFAPLVSALESFDVMFDRVGDASGEQLRLLAFLLIADIGDGEVGKISDDRKDCYENSRCEYSRPGMQL